MNFWEREAQAAAVLRECRDAFAARGTTVIDEIAGEGIGGIAEWRHYPADEVYDPVSHVQYFFHRHPGALAGGATDCGHFHLFLRGEGIPAGVTPLLLPETAVANAPLHRQSAPLKRGSRDEVCHLVAIGVDCRGEPVRLFTTNRWVSGESWYRADDVIGMLGRVRLGDGASSPLVNRWIEALVRLFQPEIATLLHDRDEKIMKWRWQYPRINVFEEVRFEIPSTWTIDLDARLAAVDSRLASASVSVVPGGREAWRQRSAREGWGA